MYECKQFLFLKEVQKVSVNIFFFLSEAWRMKDKMGVNKN